MPLLRLTPKFFEKVWGAEELGPWFENTGRKIGEVWFEHDNPLPLLIKFLFTSENLSVQVHPDDEYARQHHDSPGKTEMWHVLAAKPGSRIAAGFRDHLSAEQMRAAAESGEIEDLLEWHDAAPGDTFYIPAGTVHAIGAGLVLCEIQQMSDVTYRLYDYNRGRELHLDRAADVSHRKPWSARQAPDGNSLVSCEHFHVHRYHVESKLILVPPPQLLIVLHGEGECAGNRLKAGEAWYVAPGTPRLDLRGNLTLLGASVPRLS
jgi:mannose-6-phosphate isomerase